MVKGHFIRLGDKTTCGGEVLEADRGVTMFGLAHAREGDRVSRGKDGKTYVANEIQHFPAHPKRFVNAKNVLDCIILIWGTLAVALVKFR